MSLHGGIDTVAFVTGGVYTETYGSTEQQNICNLFASYGLIEDAPNITVLIANIVEFLKRRRND
jgi:hypothetical protein